MASPAYRRLLGGSLVTLLTLGVPVLVTVVGACDVSTGTDSDTEDLTSVIDPDGDGNNGSFGANIGGENLGLGGEGGEGANGNQGGAGQGGNGNGGTMVTTGAPCSEALPCADEGPCIQETCQSDSTCLAEDVQDDNNVCTTDTCVEDTPVNEPIMNDDMNGCTIDRCDPQDGPSHEEQINFFYESFEDGSDWTRGPQWEIDDAEAGTGGINAADDPAGAPQPPANETVTDNRVAGTRLGGGGLIGQQLTESFLTSPQIPIPSLPSTGGITLAYVRHLTIQDAPPANDPTQGAFARVVIRCGSTVPEQQIFITTRFVNDDATGGYFEVRHNVRDFLQTCLDGGETSFQVRFGFTRGDSSPSSTGGWNIDHVRLYRANVPADDDICTQDSCANEDGTATGLHNTIVDTTGPLGCDTNGPCLKLDSGLCEDPPPP